MSGLAMSNDEIVVRYRQAKNKGEQVKILAELNNCPVERIIGILTANGVDNRCFNHLRAKLKKQEEKAAKKFEKLREEHQEQLAIQAEAMKAMPPEPGKAAVAEKMQEVLYKKPEIIPGPPVPDKQVTVADAVAVIKTEIAEINRQQYELDMRKADLYKQLWDMMGEM